VAHAIKVKKKQSARRVKRLPSALKVSGQRFRPLIKLNGKERKKRMYSRGFYRAHSGKCPLESKGGKGTFRHISLQCLIRPTKSKKIWCYRYPRVVSISLDKFPPFARAHQHAQSADRLPPYPCSKVFRPKLISSRGWPTGLPHRLARHPVADNRRELLGSLAIRNGRSRTPDAESLVQLLRSFFARR